MKIILAVIALTLATSLMAHTLPRDAKIMNRAKAYENTWYFEVRAGANIGMGAPYACDFYVAGEVVASDTNYRRKTSVEALTIDYHGAKNIDAVVCYRV